MRRAKTRRDFAVREVSPKSSFGVRTRAKTLALQRFQNISPSPDDSFSFLQLRNRRLQKFLPSVIKPKKDYKEPVISSPKLSPKTNLTPGTSSAHRSIEFELGPCYGSLNYGSATPQPGLVNNAEIEVSFGENILDVEEMKRLVLCSFFLLP
ncbi:cyclin-dependent kinase inhibitor 5-like [Phalaenopsis equestris]|uniref:cyclin-dependent kinase inhibitor 5-like n=1 Tax=Phalaenopsis equestris TaxID=78828 RepID=UPI0009E5A773|nr:cyclin-dependent kinase inhibitor 5-like [Phalaenopsis equestris]